MTVQSDQNESVRKTDGLTGAQRWMATAYLDYVNNYVTLEGFADGYGITRGTAQAILKDGRIAHEKRADYIKRKGD